MILALVSIVLAAYLVGLALGVATAFCFCLWMFGWIGVDTTDMIERRGWK